MPLWRKVRGAATEVIYPKTCAGCGLRGTWLCDRCAGSVPHLDRGICFRCGSPAVRGACPGCRQLAPQITQARAAYPYRGWVTGAVQSFKYQGEWDRGESLAARMAASGRGFGALDAIVPVPLHPTRLDWRGYNQAAILADGVGARIGVPVMPLLDRTRETQAQVKLGHDERQQNMERAFALSDDWSLEPGSRVLLIDDVRTTSATLNDASRELMRTGPAAIYVLTFALDVQAAVLDAWLAEYA
jgi:ComF family protein